MPLKLRPHTLRKPSQDKRIGFDHLSRCQLGDLGFLPRRGMMDELFARAAFRLEKNEISQPVVTRFGVHLIQATAFTSGRKTWQQLRGQLLGPASQQFFDQLATEELKSAKIEFSGIIPYLDPQTRELVLPKAPPK